jgi:hypothetical protein
MRTYEASIKAIEKVDGVITVRRMRSWQERASS